ncbi:uncharacterized protein CDAR_34271 [Caerostris darwini]|uniref:Uncharacterized protein n=1 Tax=Caerostris darwini TaxID=1538125 RepID=A0AAV4V079_9ARAC|nr:uncharacterized protein CDAR_34271 [Caerostris darwini]
MTIREEMANNNSEEGLNTISDTYENSCQNQPNMKSKNLYEYHESVFNTLALLSDPVWICSNEKNSIHLTAISEWVHHQRVWMAVNKVTVAEVVGGVRGVIPSSKLATYGDYRYDLDLEEMYDILEEQNTVNYKSARRHGDEENSNHPKAENKHLDAKSEETKDHVKNEKTVQDTQDLISHDLDDWILKWTTLLRAVRRVISQEKSFDVWTDVLMKTLNKFLSALRFNTSLLKLMQTDIPFITDYRQLLKEPITTLEILSIPKPYLEGSFKLDSKQEDDLWLKLSSPSIKKLWGKNSANELQETLLSKDKTLGFDSWIGSTNFLRRQRQWKGSATTEESDDIEISEERGKEMIGSLINYIDGSTDKMERFDRKETSNIENKSKNYFPEMHKDWNRISFARRMDGVNEARANQTSNWKCYYNQQCEQQLLFKQVLSVPPPPPPMMFPPPLCIPPPPLLTTMHSFPTQKLPFYIPSSNQPLQNYNYEKLRLNLPRNHSNAWPLTSNIHQQTTIAMQNATFQSLAHTSHHTVPGNKYYNQSQITPQFQMGSSTVLQINQNIFQKRNNPTICSQSQHSYDLNQLNFDYKVNNDGNSPGIPDVNSPVSNNQDRDAYAKFFNMIADSLLFSSDKVRATKMPNMKNEKIDGWTYFKIVIQIILRNATHVLLSENIQQINCSKTVNQFVAHLKNSQKH